MVKGKSDELMRLTPFHQMQGDAGELSSFLLIQILHQQGSGSLMAIAALVEFSYKEAQAGGPAFRNLGHRQAGIGPLGTTIAPASSSVIT